MSGSRVNGQSVLVKLFVVIAVIVRVGEGLQLCQQRSENCEGDSCLKSIQCYHGDCNEAGRCECDLCWSGDNCNDYVDNHLPEFSKEEDLAIVSDPWSPEIVYTAQAYDGDLGSTCPMEAMLCDCAESRYSISSGDSEKLFHVNNMTGDIYVKEASKVVSGMTYNLTLTVSSSRGQVSPSPNANMKLKVVIDDVHHHLAKVLQENSLTWLGNIGEDSHSRSKRSAENENFMTEFNFTLVNGELETMEAGKRLDYRLEIMIPKTSGMDLTVEFFTKEIGNGNYTPVLALFNVEVEGKPNGISYSKGDQANIEMLLSDEIMTVYDRAIVSFGEVKNSNPDPVPIYMLFSITQIKNPNTMYDTKYLVTAGAEYDKETYVWVGQSEVTVHNVTDEKSLEVDIEGPKEIPLDTAGVYVMVTHCAVRSENFTFEIMGPDETHLITVGNLGVKDFDRNYDPVPQNIYFYNTTKEGSTDDVMYKSARLNLGVMTNVGAYTSPRDNGNVINITFAIYALNNETNLNKEVSFSTRVYVGREALFDQPFTVKLVPRVRADRMVTVRTTKGDLATPEVGIGDMAQYTLWSNLTNNGYADYVLEVDVLRYKGLPRLEACSARLWSYAGSFDVPYLNTTFIDPEIVNGKFLFRFNRIHVTGQRTPSIYNDSMIYVHLIMKVSAMSVNNIGTRLTPTLRIGTQGAPEHEVRVPGLEIQKKAELQEPVMDIQNGVAWPYLYVGGAIVLNVTMNVPKGVGYADVLIESSGENNPPLPAVHICRTELSEVGRNVPCLRMHQDEVNMNSTMYKKTDPKNRLKHDMTTIMLGDVGSLPVDGQNFATVSVVVELPEGSIIKEDELYPITSGLRISQNAIWSRMANYTMKKSIPPPLEEYQMPEASAHYDETKKIVPGHLAEVEIWVDTKIQTISTVTIEVEGTTKDISLCGLKIKSYGRNLPCVDESTEPFYHPHDNPLDGNKVSGLKFSALSNVGFRSNAEHDRLKATALVRIGPSCKQPETLLEWRVVYGGGKKEGKVVIKVDLDADTSDMSVSAKEPKALAFKNPFPKASIIAGSPAIVDLEVSLEPNSLAPVIVQIKNADAHKKLSYDMCLGGVWKRGRNYPCFSPVQVESNFSSSDQDTKRNDSAVFNLGLVCNTFVDNKDEENKVTIRVAMLPINDGSLKYKDTFSVEGHATVGIHPKKIDTVKFTIARDADQVETDVNGTVRATNDEAVPIRIHQRLWIPFNISIPIDAVVKVEAEARAPLKDGRAILTVHNMRLVSGGVNIPCPMRYPQPTVEFKPTVSNTQSDVIRAHLGYFTNLGLTHKMNMAQVGDDDLTIEVEVEMGDHPAAAHEKIFPLKFVAEIGKAVAEVDQPMKVYRDGSERANMDVKVHVDNKKPYVSGKQINVTVTVVHKKESTAEPINATVRLYLPPYVEYEALVFSNATNDGRKVFLVAEHGGLDIVLPQFLFSDSATIIVSLLADPRNERGFGRGEENATTPYRVLCTQNYREEPSENPPTADTIVSCGPVDYIMYVVDSQECYKKLGLFSPKLVYKCQLSASSAAKRELGPYNIRSSSKRGWSPALRLGPHKPYFEVDFLRTTRVSKLEFIRVDETRSVTKYRLQYSHTGSDWLYANEETELVYKKGTAFDTLEKPIQTRFVRVVIEEAEKGEEDTMYIGLKMEMYGCYIAEKVASVTCAKTDPTWYSDDKNNFFRHFSVDLGRDIIYFCDLEYDMETTVCYSSTDAGSSWRTLPRSFGGLLGYDRKSGRTYGIDKRKRAYLGSDDGVTWIAVDEAEYNDTRTRRTFYTSHPVPAFTSQDIELLETKTGRWEAKFDGLMYEGKLDPRARWSRCCKMTK